MASLDRRSFLSLTALALGSTIAGCAPEERRNESEFLHDFLTPGAPLAKKDIYQTLYEIRNEGSTRGHAVHLGAGYFLTAAHVVDIGGLELHSRGPGWARGAEPFEVLVTDEETDVALLRRPVKKSLEASRPVSDFQPTLHLCGSTPSLGQRVSFFTKLYGLSSRDVYDFTYDGVNFCDSEQQEPSLGRLRLPAHSLFFERMGQVLPYSECFAAIPGCRREPVDEESFSSMLVFNGDSGSPAFLAIGPDQYAFTGILTKGLGVKHWIMTPGHPLGYDMVQQTGAFFANREAILHLFDTYLTQSGAP